MFVPLNTIAGKIGLEQQKREERSRILRSRRGAEKSHLGQNCHPRRRPPAFSRGKHKKRLNGKKKKQQPSQLPGGKDGEECYSDLSEKGLEAEERRENLRIVLIRGRGTDETVVVYGHIRCSLTLGEEEGVQHANHMGRKKEFGRQTKGRVIGDESQVFKSTADNSRGRGSPGMLVWAVSRCGRNLGEKTKISIWATRSGRRLGRGRSLPLSSPFQGYPSQ